MIQNLIELINNLIRWLALLFFYNHGCICSFVVGNGCKVRFWEDVWCGETPLCSSFPSLYEVASSKGDMAAVLWEITGEGGGWNFRF